MGHQDAQADIDQVFGPQPLGKALRLDSGDASVVILGHLGDGPRRQLVSPGHVGQAGLDPAERQGQGAIAQRLLGRR